MIFNVLTLFPEMIMNGINHSIIGRAIENGLIEINTVNFRDFADNKYQSVDDYPYGGGAGMLLQVQPIEAAYKSILVEDQPSRLIYLTPQGKPFNQKMAESFAKETSLTFLCGHYEGVDERLIEKYVTDEVSLGDFVLTGGEMAAMVMIDAIGRLVPGVLKNESSSEHESFYNSLLEYPQYTRPEVYDGMQVPKVLLSGHHKNIEIWRHEQSLIRTAKKRPDLLKDASLTLEDKAFLKKHCNLDVDML